MADARPSPAPPARWTRRLARPAALWGGYALLLLAAPLLWPGSFGQAVLSQIGIAIIACLAYNLLLGQGGMLSFGHAVYTGLGAYGAMHVLNLVADGTLALPVSLVPLAGALTGAGCAALLGWACTRHSGTAFAMVTLGLGEMVWALALMLPEYFGGEAGLAGNRVLGPPVAGISFGPAREVTGLIALYCLASTALLYGFTRTPLGRLLNAVRDNPERVAFTGYDPRVVRYLAFVVAGFFAGLAGGLSAVLFEMVSTEALAAHRSATYLLFVYLGGAGSFVGPIIGAVLMVLSLVGLSSWTPAWLFYLGLLFMAMVVVPGGIASLRWPRALPPWPAWLLGLATAATLSCGVLLVELLYRLRLDAALRPALRLAGWTLDPARTSTWLAVAAALALSSGLLLWCRARWQACRQAGH